MSTLVIIDMQTDFTESFTDEIVDHIVSLIEDHIFESIVLVELDGCGRTIKPIFNALLYETDLGFALVKKRCNNGYPNIKRKFSDTDYVVVGVNAQFCVLDTVADMIRDDRVERVYIETYGVGDEMVLSTLVCGPDYHNDPKGTVADLMEQVIKSKMERYYPVEFERYFHKVVFTRGLNGVRVPVFDSADELSGDYGEFEA